VREAIASRETEGARITRLYNAAKRAWLARELVRLREESDRAAQNYDVEMGMEGR
jgi:hypothetical protein